MRQRNATCTLGGEVQIDDAYLGGSSVRRADKVIADFRKDKWSKKVCGQSLRRFLAVRRLQLPQIAQHTRAEHAAGRSYCA